MSLLKSDLMRNFAIGFLLGAMVVTFQGAPAMWLEAAPDAVANVLR